MSTDQFETLDDDLRMRISSTEMKKFKEKAINVTGKPYQLLLREFITAFNAGRLRVVPTEEQKTQLGELYNAD